MKDELPLSTNAHDMQEALKRATKRPRSGGVDDFVDFDFDEVPEPTAPELPPVAPPAAEFFESRGEAAPARGESCVIIGPTNAGKTCMLAAINAACYSDAADPDCTLSVVCTREEGEDDHLSKYIVDWIGRELAPFATEELRNYELEVATRVQGRLLRRAEIITTTIRCADAPGGSFFSRGDDVLRVDRDIVRALTSQAKGASTLVLVLDAQNPTVDLLELHLPRVLDSIALNQCRETPPQSQLVRILERLGWLRMRDGGRRTRLQTKRVLVLLSKIDMLAEALCAQMREQGVATTPLAVAQALDPLGLALELLGTRPLRRILRTLDIDAELAVGVISTTGFVHENGQSFDSWRRDRSKEERLRTWRSFGIQEAVLFMTTGRCVGPIRRVSADWELSLDGAIEAPEFPFRTGMT